RNRSSSIQLPRSCVQKSRQLVVTTTTTKNRIRNTMKLIDTLLVLAFTAATVVEAQTSLKPDIRGVATRAPQGMKIDGDLSEFANAFATPLEYFQPEKPSKTNP